jgi:hypothetical protein
VFCGAQCATQNTLPLNIEGVIPHAIQLSAMDASGEEKLVCYENRTSFDLVWLQGYANNNLCPANTKNDVTSISISSGTQFLLNALSHLAS